MWLDPTQSPNDASFDLNTVDGPPYPNPEAWWRLTDAIYSVIEKIANDATHGKKPWIKAGDVLIDQDKIRQIWKTLQARIQQ